METCITLGFISLSVCWFISTVIIWICKTGRRREYAESVSHRKRMARLERLRRSREEEGLDSGRGEEFDELYAREREERRRHERSRRNRRKRKSGTEPDDAERVDARSVRDVLRRRLMGEESSSSRRDGNNYAEEEKPSKRAKKPGIFKTKLQELSMSPRTRKKKKKESERSEKTQETSAKDYRDLHSRRSKYSTSSRDTSSTEESKTGSESAKGRRGSWLFKSARKRRKEQLQQELELRRKVRAQTISPKRRKLTSAHKQAAESLLSSPVRYDGSRLHDVSTARFDDVTTARNMTDSTSKRLKRDQRSHQTARDLVKEDLKKRLQQMDFKLTPSKTPTALTSEKENILSNNRGNGSEMMSTTGSMRSSRRSSRRRPRPSSGQRGQQRRSESIRQADSPKYSGAGRRKPLRRSTKHQNQRKRQVSDDSAIPDNSDSTSNSQKEREKKPSESNEASMEESETAEKVSTQNRQKDRKVRIAGKEGQKSGKAIRSSGRLSKERKNERNRRHGNFEGMLAHQQELEKKILSVKGLSGSKKKERKEPKRGKSKDEQRYSLKVSISSQNRNLNESFSQQSTGKSSSLKVRKLKKKESKAKFVDSQDTGGSVKKTKKRSRNYQNSSKTLNTATGNKLSSRRENSSCLSSSGNHKTDRTETSTETKTPKKLSKSTISLNESVQSDKSAGEITEQCGAKSDSMSLSSRFTESESSTLERSTKKSRMAAEFGRKHKNFSAKKSNLNLANKKRSGKAVFRSSSNGAKKRFKKKRMERGRSESFEEMPGLERTFSTLKKGSKRKLISISGKKVKSRTSMKEKFSSKHNHAKAARSELFAAAVGK